MGSYRYEVEPRPVALGGGWRLHLFGPDPETDRTVRLPRSASWPVYCLFPCTAP